MKTSHLIILVSILIFSIICFSCRKNKTSNLDSTKVYQDIDMLGEILDFSNYKPQSVQFQYKPVISSIEGRQPDLLPDPKDYVLEAVLNFSPQEITKIKKEVKNTAITPDNETEMLRLYTFSWLPETLKTEIQQQKNVKEYPATMFFDTGTSNMIILNDKIILIALTH